jgi:LysR family transcriptional regulator, glycine cleavage system transcriptional activator
MKYSQNVMNLYHAVSQSWFLAAMVRHLPPFAPLVAFDAVARHRSFTRAAEELGVTQSAVSHQIRRLERFYGVQLLLRLNPGVELSAEGTILRGELAILLDNIAGLTPRLRRRPGLRTIRLGAGMALAGWWLVRRLPSFQQAHPDITLEFEPIETEQDAARSVDLRIVWTSLVEARPNSTQAPLFQERVVPVCAPRLLPGGKPLADPADLAELPLIQKGAGSTGEWSWEFWFKALALHRTVPRGPVLRDLGLCHVGCRRRRRRPRTVTTCRRRGRRWSSRAGVVSDALRVVEQSSCGSMAPGTDR